MAGESTSAASGMPPPSLFRSQPSHVPSSPSSFGLGSAATTATSPSTRSRPNDAMSPSGDLSSYPLFARRRPSLLSTEVAAHTPGLRNAHSSDTAMVPEEADEDDDMADVDEAEETAARNRRRSSQSSTGSHSASTFRALQQPGLPGALSAFRVSAPVDRSFNPLNPRGESTVRRERELSTGSDAPMQLDFPTLEPIRQSSSGSPILLEAPTSSPALPRSRSSPGLSLLAGPSTGPLSGQATPPQQSQRRFASVDMAGNDTEQLEVPLSPVSSTSGRAAGPAVKRVSRRGNLFPKTKAHMRVAAELQQDTAAVPESEAAQEAAIFRAAKSGPSSINVGFSVFAGGKPAALTTGKATLNNRFPEQAGEDDDPKSLRASVDSSGSDEETSDAFSRGPDGMQMDEDTTDSPYDDTATGAVSDDPAAASQRRIAALWSLRDTRPSPRLNLGDFDHSPGTPAWSSGSSDRRPNKRKADDGSSRFEPYSSLAFKRRAVSPTASSIAGSPVLAAQNSGSGHLPTPSPGPSISLPHASFFSAMRSGSPSPAAAGITFVPPAFSGLVFPSQHVKDDEGDKAGDVLSSMTIG